MNHGWKRAKNLNLVNSARGAVGTFSAIMENYNFFCPIDDYQPPDSYISAIYFVPSVADTFCPRMLTIVYTTMLISRTARDPTPYREIPNCSFRAFLLPCSYSVDGES